MVEHHFTDFHIVDCIIVEFHNIDPLNIQT
jgi:hypothetical protein